MAKGLVSGSNNFDAVVSIIENARSRALKAVNTELIHMYWEVGEYLSGLCAESSFKKVLQEKLRELTELTMPKIE